MPEATHEQIRKAITAACYSSYGREAAVEIIDNEFDPTEPGGGLRDYVRMAREDLQRLEGELREIEN